MLFPSEERKPTLYNNCVNDKVIKVNSVKLQRNMMLTYMNTDVILLSEE